MSMWTPPSRPLMLPGDPKRRMIGRPDLRHVVTPRLSGAVLGAGEVDYDDREIVRSWRTYEWDRPGEVRYFMLEVAQRNPGETTAWHGFKAVPFARLSRIPRWLRQQGSGVGRPGFSQMSYVLAALREQGVLFVQMVAKSPDSQMIFAYGVQALGSTAEEAQQRADDAYGSLCALLADRGTFHQVFRFWERFDGRPQARAETALLCAEFSFRRLGYAAELGVNDNELARQIGYLAVSAGNGELALLAGRLEQLYADLAAIVGPLHAPERAHLDTLAKRASRCASGLAAV